MSKRILQHPEIPAGENTISWRSVGQLEGSQDFRNTLDREFPRAAAEMADEADAETSRRSFLKLMGASTALAGLSMAACRRPEKYTVPYTQAPEWIIPGKALYYASAMPRPSAVEAPISFKNERRDVSASASSAISAAARGNSRSRVLRKSREPSSWPTLRQEMVFSPAGISGCCKMRLLMIVR